MSSYGSIRPLLIKAKKFSLLPYKHRNIEHVSVIFNFFVNQFYPIGTYVGMYQDGDVGIATEGVLKLTPRQSYDEAHEFRHDLGDRVVILNKMALKTNEIIADVQDNGELTANHIDDLSKLTKALYPIYTVAESTDE